MEIYTTISEIKEFIKSQKLAGEEIGFVPTMGYLHQGHLSLMKEARQDNDIVIASIFVNPTQFGPDEDYKEYPRDLDRDAELAAEVGADIIFAPDVDEIYSPNAATTVQVEGLTDKLCGACRPGHFTGVCTIVSKLFNIVNPDRAYFGQKDAQQVLVIKRMVKDLNFDLDIVTVPIVREEDGLAVSSRNKYLNQAERGAAIVLYKSLQLAQGLIEDGVTSSLVIKEQMLRQLTQESLAKVDYVEVVNQDTLEKVEEVQGKVLIALAVYIGETRLIDNLMLEV
ncbi:pantoate--beta-alanine ligase [Halanaerocella petrolearia]